MVQLHQLGGWDMARRRKARSKEQIEDYRHKEAQRKNNPPAGIALTYEIRERRTTRYAYWIPR